MKKITVIYWTATIILFLFEGLMPALTSQTEMAKEGIRHLGYPSYFGNMLVVFKIAGSLALLIPQVPKRIKEWAYAGFAIEFIAAFVSLTTIDGLHLQNFFPLLILAILIVSYITYHRKIKGAMIQRTMGRFNSVTATA
jgi:hypothetical protein